MVKYVRLFWWITVLSILVDQASKYIFNRFHLQILVFKVTQNTGAGFGILQQQTVLLTIISGIVALGIILFYKKIPQEKWPQILWALFLGGVWGNFIDRVFRGYVIDFIDVGFWPVFNIADAAITMSVAGLIVYYWRK